MDGNNDLSERLLFQNDDDDGDGLTGNGRLSRSGGIGGVPGIFLHQYGGNRNSINPLNVLNVLCYVAHVVVVYGVGFWGAGGHVFPLWFRRTAENPTLIMPNDWLVFACWYPILALEGAFSVAQLFSEYRNRPIVQSGTALFYLYTTLFQIAWIFFYCAGFFIPSFLTLVGALLTLLYLLYSQEQQLLRRNSGGRAGYAEYLLFRLPFYWETGWMMVLTAHHFSLVFKAYGAPLSVQVGVDIYGLAVLLVAAIFMLVQQRDIVTPLVILVSFVRPSRFRCCCHASCYPSRSPWN